MEAELAQVSTSKAEMSAQMEQLAASHLNLETKLQEEQEAKIQLQEELEASRRNLEESQAEVKTIQQQLNTTVGDLEVLISEMRDETEKHLRHVGEIQANKEKAEAQLEEEVSQRVQLVYVLYS